MRTSQWTVASLLFAGATALSMGCDRKEAPQRVEQEQVGARPSDGTSAAVESITAARCDREQRCNNIGSGKKYDSRDSCVTNVRADWQGELSSLECPRGIEQTKLDACLDRLRTDGCANPVETLGRVAACRHAELCRAG